MLCTDATEHTDGAKRVIPIASWDEEICQYEALRSSCPAEATEQRRIC